jgi:hypothetical protein
MGVYRQTDVEPIKIITMKAKTFLPLFTGFYGSIWDDVDFYGEDEYYKLPEGTYFEDMVDWETYHETIAKKMCEFVEEELRPFVSDITFERIASPKYYNFENDAIYIDVEFDYLKVYRYLLANFQTFDRYIADRYTSRDGFISYHSIDPFDWLDEFTNDEHKLGAVMDFILRNEEVEEPMYFDDLHISSFYKDEISQYYINEN